MENAFEDLLEQFAGPRVPGQPRLPVRVDVDARTLELCGVRSQADPASGNRGILEAFVALVSAVRQDRPRSIGQLRRMDLVELGRLLDLNDARLARDLELVLGLSAQRAAGVAERLLRADRMRRTDRFHEARRLPPEHPRILPLPAPPSVPG